MLPSPPPTGWAPLAWCHRRAGLRARSGEARGVGVRRPCTPRRSPWFMALYALLSWLMCGGMPGKVFFECLFQAVINKMTACTAVHKCHGQAY